MRKNIKLIALTFTLFLGLSACGTSESVTETSTEAVTEKETEEIKEDKTEPDTVATVIDIADVAEDGDGNIIDAVSHAKLTEEEIEDRIKRGIIKKDEKTGKLTIVEEKNTRKAGVTIDAKTNKIITAEGSDGTSYKIEDGKIKAPGNKGDVKVDVKKDDKKAKAEVTTQEAKKDDGKKTDKSTAAVTTENPKTTESAKKDNTEKTEKRTEQKAEEKKEEKKEQPKKEEKKEEKKPEAKKEEKKQEPATEKKPEATTEKKPEISTQAPACSHNWVWHTHTETVHKSEKYLVSDAWDEPVYETHNFCNGCGCDLDATYGGAGTSGGIGHLDSCGTGFHTGSVQVGTVHHDAVYDTDEWDETVEVNDYQYCSKCGEKK